MGILDVNNDKKLDLKDAAIISAMICSRSRSSGYTPPLFGSSRSTKPTHVSEDDNAAALFMIILLAAVLIPIVRLMYKSQSGLVDFLLALLLIVLTLAIPIVVCLAFDSKKAKSKLSAQEADADIPNPEDLTLRANQPNQEDPWDA